MLVACGSPHGARYEALTQFPLRAALTSDYAPEEAERRRLSVARHESTHNWPAS
jgi:hypothetical protein